MSNAFSALQGVSDTGFAHVKEMGLVGMVTLKADLDAAITKKAVKSAIGEGIPAARGMSDGSKPDGVAWMAPDELLFLCKHEEAEGVVNALTKGMGDAHHLAVNVSDARAVFTIEARDVREVLGKLTPANLADLKPREIRRSRFAQVPAAFWMNSPNHATVICFRSVAQYMFDLLVTAAKEGAEVRYY